MAIFDVPYSVDTFPKLLFSEDLHSVFFKNNFAQDILNPIK